MDGRNDKGEPIVIYDKDYGDDQFTLKLGHSCDEWVIGSLQDAKAFIKQLAAAIARAEASPDEEFDNYD